MSNLTAFQEALRFSPENVPLLLLYGTACMEELALEEALAAFEKAVELEPRHTDAQLGLARVLLAQGDASRAAVRAEMALQQDAGSAAAHLLLSRIHLTEGDLVRARQHFETAAHMDHSLVDSGLENELDFRPEPPRRSSGRGMEAGDAGGGMEPSFHGYGEDAGDPESDLFLDEPPYDWRPETFWMPGDPERQRLGFEDIAGLDEIKEEIRRKIVYPLQQPELHRAYGHQAGGALLLYGPPGCGKTMLLRAVAAEIPCNYLSVGLHEIFDPYFGSTERNLHQMFETARFNGPCVLVIDGLDSLAQDRRQLRDAQLRNVVNQLLHELDALRSDGRRVLVLGATSQPWSLDPALRRPGRFEQALFVPPPDGPTRQQLLQRCASEKPVGAFDVEALVAATEGFSGADLQWVFDRAAELALGEAMRQGQPVPIPGDLLLKVAREHLPTTMRQWFEGAEAESDGGRESSFLVEVRKFMADRPMKR